MPACRRSGAAVKAVASIDTHAQCTALLVATVQQRSYRVSECADGVD
jgi:hypothetical protein